MRVRASVRSLGVLAATSVLAAGCGDEPTQPLSAKPALESEALPLGDAERSDLGAAFAFAREQVLRGLRERDAADHVAAALAVVAARVEAGDRAGAEQALAAAGRAIQQYRRHAGDDRANEADLEALMLTLDHATAIVRERAVPTAEVTPTTPSTVER